MINRLTYLFVVILISACASVDTPQTHYYRLPATSASVPLKILQPLQLAAFKSSGILTGNSLLYSESSRPNEIRAFAYHQWYAPLTKLLTEQLEQFSQKSGIKEISRYEFKPYKGWLVLPSVHQMEIVYSNNASKLVVAISFTVKNSDGKSIFSQRYEIQQSIDSKDIYQLVTGYTRVLEKIYAEFFTDLSAL